MADAGDAVYAIAQAAAAVTALIGTRFYPVTFPESGTYPAGRYQLISAPRAHAMGSDTGDVMARVQVDAKADTYAGACALREAFRGAFQRFRGTAGGVTVMDVLLESQIDLFDDEAKMFVCTLDLMVAYKEA